MNDLNFGAIRKADEELRIVWAEVYAPGIPDSQGDFMTADEVRKMAHKFLASGRVQQIDIQHNNKVCGCVMVESFVNPLDNPMRPFIPGAWVAAVHIPDPELWAQVKSGELNGFSLEGLVQTKETEIFLQVPEEVSGVTSMDNGHRHEFTVQFSSSGELLGGRTSMDNGHMHVISQHTVTDEAMGHTHRYSFTEALQDPEEVPEEPVPTVTEVL